MTDLPETHVAIPRDRVRKMLDLMGVAVADDASDEDLTRSLSKRIRSAKGRPLKDVFDPGQLSGISTPTDPGTTPIAPPAIDPAVKALYQAAGFSTAGY